MPLVFLILAFALSYLLTPFVSRFASRCGAVDFPGERKVHEGIIPRFGGVAIFASFVFVIAGYYLWFTPSGWIVLRGSRVFGIAAAGVLIFALGVYDDLRGTNAWVKFSVQLVAAFLIVWNGDVIRIVTNPAGGQINLGILAVPVTILWLVGVTNAFNLIDGADGVACGIGAIVAGTMAFVGAYNGNYESATIAATLCGALLGFLRYNFYPAKIFMGDSGALFVGFCLATLAIKTSQVSAATVSFLTPLVALGLPIMDTSLSFFRRVHAGKNPFHADCDHIHHRLLRETLSHRWTAFILYLFCFILNVTALVLLYRNNWVLALCIVPVILLLAVSPFVRRKLRLTGNGNGAHVALPDAIAPVRRKDLSGEKSQQGPDKFPTPAS
jgi:UDP-GlcNAc:undecaprenyl-phosphate GlcNAc-1-phosphate transferase